MHTGGEPVRIVESGYPEIIGATILDKRRYARQHLDHLRKLLMFEPRGHSDMYGVIPVEVGGHTHYSGSASFVAEPDDPLAGGFLVR